MSKTSKHKLIAGYKSAVRLTVSESHGLPYKPLKTLEEARKYNDSYLVMEGDWGGQIYLAIPVILIKCSYEILKSLLKELDKILWEINEGEGSGIYFERMRKETSVIGGMGGGMATNAIWIHKDLTHLKKKIIDVIYTEVKNEAQKNFIKFGAKDKKHLKHV